MDKDLASAILLERCQCYDKSLESAKKVLEKNDANSDESLWARKIVKSLGEVFLAQRFMDKAMECYEVLLTYPMPENVCPTPPHEAPPETGKPLSLDDLGPNTVTVATQISPDAYEILSALKNVEGNRDKDEATLLREGICQLFLKYADDKQIRELIFDKIRRVVDQ